MGAYEEALQQDRVTLDALRKLHDRLRQNALHDDMTYGEAVGVATYVATAIRAVSAERRSLADLERRLQGTLAEWQERARTRHELRKKAPGE